MKTDKCDCCGRPLPAVFYTRDQLLTEYVQFADLPTGRVAELLGMTVEAFSRAMYRAKAAGDPRAAGFTVRRGPYRQRQSQADLPREEVAA